MKIKNSALIIRFLLIFAGAIGGIYLLYNVFIYSAYFISIKKMPQVILEDYVRLMIYGSSSENDTVSASFSIIDSNGNDIATIERSWSGSYLEVEFGYLSYKGKEFYFPARIYGKQKIFDTKNSSKNTSLEKYYNENNQCLLLGYGSSLENRKTLYFISKFANKKLGVINLGISKKYIVDLSNCESGSYYSISYNDEIGLVIYKL